MRAATTSDLIPPVGYQVRGPQLIHEQWEHRRLRGLRQRLCWTVLRLDSTVLFADDPGKLTQCWSSSAERPPVG